MKRFILLAILLSACEDPISHFTENPPKPKEPCEIKFQPADSLASQDTARCAL